MSTRSGTNIPAYPSGVQVADALHEEFRKVGTGGSPLMVMNRDSHEIYEVVEVVTEYHVDADGSYTTWLVVEDY